MISRWIGARYDDDAPVLGALIISGCAMVLIWRFTLYIDLKGKYGI